MIGIYAMAGDKGSLSQLPKYHPHPYKVLVRVGVRFPDPPAGFEFCSSVRFLATSNPVYFTQPT